MDNKFYCSTYQVSYKAKVNFNNNGDEEFHAISKIHNNLPACFATILNYIPYNMKDKDIDLDINIIFRNTYKKDQVVFPNRTFFDADQIKFWLDYIGYLFNTEITVTSEEKDDVITYDVHVDVTKNKGQIIMILTLIRFLYEHPYSYCLYMAMQYKTNYPELSLLYILNCLFVIYNTVVYIGGGHYYDQAYFIPKNFNNSQYKEILNMRLPDGYSYCQKWSESEKINSTNPKHKKILKNINTELDKVGKKNKIAICSSYDSLFNGEAYKLFVKPLDYLINETN